jgi:hypothetical protein
MPVFFLLDFNLLVTCRKHLQLFAKNPQALILQGFFTCSHLQFYLTVTCY